MDVLEAARALRSRDVPFALATVVRREPPVSARPGDKAVVAADGRLDGWVGGSCAHAAVVTTALRALADGAPRLLVLDPSPGAERRSGVDVFPMACHSGGTLEIYVEPFLPRPRLVLVGASPVAETLARLASAVGYRVFVLDPVASRERFPDAEALFTDVRAAAAFGEGGGGGEVFVLVTTMGHADEEALEAALARAPRYVGLVASRRRFAEVRRTLAARGVPPEALDRVRSPAGLDLGARSPEEIAVSVLAEIVQVRRREAPHADASRGGGSAPSRFVVDPVCGMSVDRDAAAATATRRGVTYYFCCDGCRAKFEAEPAGGVAPA